MMNLRNIRGFLILLFFVCSAASMGSAEEEGGGGAPFGLTWGASKSQVEALGVRLTAADEKQGTAFTATNLPKMLSDAEIVRLNFGFDDRLMKVNAVSRNYEKDPYGMAVKARYNELKILLSDKYGRGSSIERLGDSIYSNPEHFIYGLYSGENWWITTFKKDKVEVELSVRGLTTDVGCWVLIFTRSDLEADFKKALSQKEKGAL